MLEHEQPSLMPRVAPFDGDVETLGKVSSTCLVSPDRNRYSVPCELSGQVVSLRLYPAQIDIVAHDAVVASHPRSFTRQQMLYDWQHDIPLVERKPGALRNGAPFADMPAPLPQLRSRLRRRKGGDRALAGIDSGLKERENDPLEKPLDEAHRRIGELVMEVEILRKERRAKHPLVGRRSSR